MGVRHPLPRQLVLSAAVHARTSELHRALGDLVVQPLDADALTRFTTAQRAALAAREELCAELDFERLFADAADDVAYGLADDARVQSPDRDGSRPDAGGDAG
ncbi:hypothetical protein [Jiangella rhizosphaerae]|uniref:Uncharacterized protein n=1 Tax=Jiangella rhizosphaerae TaxID=2293569 RepID=A0A418KHU8_9ACTN|nr:hypothetical protein [Jiangella rhizosphaerae]RIQ12216.1 hypothetical protein DY240_27370 [Jiangella rhizosphaerae]